MTNEPENETPAADKPAKGTFGYLCAALCASAASAYFVDFDSLLWFCEALGAVFSISLSLWVYSDARRLEKKAGAWAAGVFFAWPFVLPAYLVSSRGISRWPLILGAVFTGFMGSIGAPAMGVLGETVRSQHALALGLELLDEASKTNDAALAGRSLAALQRGLRWNDSSFRHYGGVFAAADIAKRPDIAAKYAKKLMNFPLTRLSDDEKVARHFSLMGYEAAAIFRDGRTFSSDFDALEDLFKRYDEIMLLKKQRESELAGIHDERIDKMTEMQLTLEKINPPDFLACGRGLIDKFAKNGFSRKAFGRYFECETLGSAHTMEWPNLGSVPDPLMSEILTPGPKSGQVAACFQEVVRLEPRFSDAYFMEAALELGQLHYDSAAKWAAQAREKEVAYGSLTCLGGSRGESLVPIALSLEDFARAGKRAQSEHSKAGRKAMAQWIKREKALVLAAPAADADPYAHGLAPVYAAVLNSMEAAR